MFTWTQFKSEVKSLLSDATINDSTAALAISHYTKGCLARDVAGDLNLHAAHMRDYNRERRRLLGYTYTGNDAALKAAVRLLMSDAAVNDDTAVRCVVDYVRAQFRKDIEKDLNGFNLAWQSFLPQRKRLLGHAITLDDTTLQARVRELLLDATINDDTAVRAVVDYVKAMVARDVDGSDGGYAANYAAYINQRNRLAGYTITLDTNTLRSRVRALITDSSVTDDTAVRAVVDYVRANYRKDYQRDMAAFQADWALYQKQRRRLLGYSLTLDDATLQARVRELLTDQSSNDTAAVRAAADYTKAILARDVFRDDAAYKENIHAFERQRERLLGYTPVMNDSTLKAEVRALITDATASDDAAVRAVANFTRANYRKEYDKDLQSYQADMAEFQNQRRRLTGYSITLDDATLQTRVRELLTDGSINDTTGYRAVADYTKAILARDVFNDLPGYQANMAAYEKQRARLLGYTISISGANLYVAIKPYLTDSQMTDDVAVRAVAEFIRGKYLKDFAMDIPGYEASMAHYNSVRRRLVGYTITYDDTTLLAKVKELLTDTSADNTTAVQAVADYVKARIAREVNRDIAAHDSYMASYQRQRVRLLGFTITLDANTLRTNVNRLITVDSNRDNLTNFIDDTIAQAKQDILALNTYIDRYMKLAKTDIAGLDGIITRSIDQAREDILGLNTWVNKTIAQGKLEISNFNTMIDNTVLQAKNEIIGLSTYVNKTIAQGKIDISGFNDFINNSIDQAKIDISGLNTYINKQIAQAKVEISGFATLIDQFILQGKTDLASLAALVDKHIRQGVIEIQSYIDFYRKSHETVYQSEDFTDEGEASVGLLPEGAEPRDAYMVRVGVPGARQPLNQYDWGNRFDLVAGNIKIRNCQLAISIDPQGKSFYVFPKVEEDRQVSLFWDGRKLDFADNDTVPFDEPMAKAVADYVSAHIELEVLKIDRAEAAVKMASYQTRRTLLYVDSKDRRRFKETAASIQAGSTCAPVVPEDTLVEFIAFGDSGETSTLADTAAVSELAHALDPDFILHLGDSVYPNANPLYFEDNLLKYYRDYIDEKLFFLGFGNHDLDYDNGAALLNRLAHLKDLNAGKLYYQFTRGEVTVFVLNTNLKTDMSVAIAADGVGTGSTQETWLKAQVAACSSKWKIAVVHHAPYCSESGFTPGVTQWQIDWKTAGVDLVLSGHGHCYERILRNDVPFLVCGLGGATKVGFGATTTGSQFRYNAKNGFLKISANATRLMASMVAVDQTIIDQLVLSK